MYSCIVLVHAEKSVLLLKCWLELILLQWGLLINFINSQPKCSTLFHNLRKFAKHDLIHGSCNKNLKVCWTKLKIFLWEEETTAVPHIEPAPASISDSQYFVYDSEQHKYEFQKYLDQSCFEGNTRLYWHLPSKQSIILNKMLDKGSFHMKYKSKIYCWGWYRCNTWQSQYFPQNIRSNKFYRNTIFR